MHLELVEVLRCPREHAESVLVASADRTANRFVLEGALGCPECGSEYPIENGIARIGNSLVSDNSLCNPEFAPGAGSAALTPAEAALRVAAQLAMTDGRTVYALVGFDAQVALNIRAMLPARLLLIDCRNLESLGDPSVSLADSPAALINARGGIPLTRAKIDGIAFATAPAAAALQLAFDALKPRGRMVAPAGVGIPSGLGEIVRDEFEWVAARDAAVTAPIGITRRAR